MSLARLLKVFLAALLISFAGSLPLGTVNVAAMQISINEGYSPAFLFAMGCVIVEMIYVRLSLVMMDTVLKHKRILRILEWISLMIISALAVASFVAASNRGAEPGNMLLSNAIPSFFLGVFMMGINAMQIPFWFGWSTVLFDKKILQPHQVDYNIYIVGIGLGSLLGSGVFIFSGQLMINLLKANQSMLNWLIGGVFAITTLVYFVKIIRKKGEWPVMTKAAGEAQRQ